MPCWTASSKLCGEVAEISVTRATDMTFSSLDGALTRLGGRGDL
jgi:hypothetical protein